MFPYPASPATNSVPVVTASNTVTYETSGTLGVQNATQGKLTLAGDGSANGGALILNGETSGSATLNATATGSTLNLGSTNLQAASGGALSTYNGVTLTGDGLPYQVATLGLTSESGAVGATTLYGTGTGGAGMYRLDGAAYVTTAAGTSSSVLINLICTNGSGTATILGNAYGGNTLGGAATVSASCYSSASQNIKWSTVYASNPSGAMVYSITLRLYREGP